MRDFFVWMNETPWSIALRESFYTWPIIELTHVATLMIFFGTIVMVDLRLLGLAFKDTPVSRIDRAVLPWTVGAFAVLVITGLLLLYSKPLVYFDKFFFRAKLVLIFLAMINILVFHFRVQKNQDEWDTAEKPPQSARISAAISLSAWIVVIVLGRFIAYDWYDCPKLKPGGFMHTFSGCPVYEVQNTGGAL